MLNDLPELLAAWFAAWRLASNEDLKPYWHIYERMMRDYDMVIRRRLGQWNG